MALSPKNKFLSKVLLLISSSIISLFCLEYCSQLIYFHTIGSNLNQAELFLGRMNPKLNVPTPSLESSVFPPKKSLGGYTHPYFGFLWQHSFEVKYSSSFLSDLKKDTFLILVVGGSVAGSIANRKKTIIEQLLLNKFSPKGKDIKIVNFAEGGWKQPQQLFAINYLLAMGVTPNIIINIDGLNEIQQAIGLSGRKVHPIYPQFWPVLGHEKLSQEMLELFIPFVTARKKQRWIIAMTKRFSLIAKSNFLSGLFDLYFRRLEKQARQSYAKIKNNKSDLKKSPQVTGPKQKFTSREQLFDWLSQFWLRTSKQIDYLCTGAKCRYFHFLQPNQYVLESKIFSAEEKNIAFRNFNKPIGRGYKHFIQAGKTLKNDGTNFTDLTDIFKEETRTIYKDSCCHMNKLGYDIIATKMAGVIAKDYQHSPE